MLTRTEENYLKAIFKIAEKENKSVATNAIAKRMQTAAASVTDMIKKLAEKELINYQKYRGVTLTESGRDIAMRLIRRHRLWEVFLVNKLRFSWENVHELAEELEHLNSNELVRRLDAFLDYPKYDPHGDPIPNEQGKFTIRSQTPLSNMHQGEQGILVGVRVHDKPFLQYLNELNISLGTKIKVSEKYNYDQSQKVWIDNKKEVVLSQKVSHNLFLKKVY